MENHPSVLGINAFSQQVVDDARSIYSGGAGPGGRNVAQPMRITLESGPHYISRVIDVDYHADPDTELELVSQVVQSMIFRLRFRTEAPPASWTWTFQRIEV